MSLKEVHIPMIDLDNCKAEEFHEILRLSIDNLDYDKFVECLDKGLDGFSVETLYDTVCERTVFERVCQLPGADRFIKLCIEKYGADVNKENEELGRFPIHFAVDSLDIENFKALIESNNVDLNKLYDNRTAILMLCQRINDENYEKTSECIKYLISKRVDMNICDVFRRTPIIFILRSNLAGEKKAELLQHIFNTDVDIDLDSFFEGEARKTMTNEFPHIQIKGESEDRVATVSTLLADLDKSDETIFIKNFESFISNTSNAETDNNLLKILNRATKAGKKLAVNALILKGADINKEFEKISPIQLASLRGFHEILELLLQQEKIEIPKDSILCTIIKEMGCPERENDICNYSKCYKTLLKCSKIDVHQTDEEKCSPLFYAVKYKNTEVILELLQKYSAYIGTKNNFNDIAINEIPPELLEKYFDSCVEPNKKRSGDKEYEIYIDFSCLVPLNARKSGVNKNEKNIVNSKSEEMVPIEYIANTRELQHLLMHPVIIAFLFLKWHKIRNLFLINFAIFSAYFISLIAYIMCCYQNNSDSQLHDFLYYVLVFLVLYVLLRELMQFLLSPKSYLQTFANYVELCLVGLTMTILFVPNLPEPAKRIVSSVSILLAGSEFTFLFGAMPYLSMSVHMAMLKTVTLNFLKSLALYSIYILAFAFSFYTLFHENSEAAGDRTDKADNDSSEFKMFSKPASAIMKTIVMMTGEFEAADFDYSPMSYIVLVLFIFLIAIVMFNLLNGLAVSDTQAIQMEAELVDLKERTHLLSNYEQIVAKPNSTFECFKLLLLKLGIQKSSTSLFPDFIPNYKIQFAPNATGSLVSPKKSDEKSDNRTNTLNCTIDPIVIKYSNKVIEKKIREKEEEDQKQAVDDRMKNMESQIEALPEKLMERIMPFLNLNSLETAAE